jgi:hypothetical protein
MTLQDSDPSGGNNRGPWSRWDSARVAVEGVMEVALSLDSDAKVDLMFWAGERSGLNKIEKIITQPGEVKPFFDNNLPKNGTTPLAEALNAIYETKLHQLLAKSEPFTCLIFTDGTPDDPEAVKRFLKRVIVDNRLEEKNRETLAAFSFVRMGDDEGAKRFLKDLDDNLVTQMDVRVDIADTKADEFIFFRGEYLGKTGCGPFALLYDAIYD